MSARTPAMNTMRRALMTMVVLAALLPTRVAAQTPMSGRPVHAAATLSDAFAREASRMAVMAPVVLAPREVRQRQPPRRSFFERHPIWSGVLIGAGTGTAIAAGAWGSEGAFVGFYGGAAAGATTGWLLVR